MATIADLAARLEREALTLGPPATDASLDAYVAGWMLLADRTRHAVTYLPLGGRPEKVGVGLRTVLDPLASGPRHPLPADTEPVAALARLALSMGAIGDVLAANLRNGTRPEYVGAEAAKLEATLLAPVHLAARWSGAGLEHQEIPRNRASIRGLLDDLAAVTEPWALIPPAHRGSVLEDLRILTTSAPGLEGATVAWADEALLVLTDRYRVSGWAMQAIAGNLALISQTALGAVQAATPDGRLPTGDQGSAQALAESSTAWRAAATWPPHVRLGGKATDLRAPTRDLQQQLASDPPQTLAETRNLIRLALPIAQAHTSMMDNLVAKHELWVHGPSLGPSAGDLRGWAREPWWSTQGVPMRNAARTAYRALDQACASLAGGTGRPPTAPLPLGWPPPSAERIRVPAGHLDVRREPQPRRGPDR